jgi:tetratricopeptide (TPR) repeat protein
MLEGLDAIDWSSLEHAYGPAADVPEMIRALADADPDVRDEAFHAAYGNIFHQGTRYTATPKAIPFLVELAAQPAPRSLVQLLGLVTHCVAGYLSPTTRTRQPMTDYGETTELLEACAVAAEPAVPVCLRLLDHSDADVRAGACWLLAALPRFADRYEVTPRLRDRLSRDPSPRVRAMIVFALGRLLPASDTTTLASVARDDRNQLVRLLAVMACVNRDQAAPDLVSRLVEWLSDEELDERYLSLPFQSHALAGDVGALLARLPPPMFASALPGMIALLRTASDFGIEGVLMAAIAGTFGDQPPPPTPTAAQRELLEALAHNQGFWSNGNALGVLQDANIPSRREDVAAYLGITVTTDPIEAARIGARMFKNFGAQKALEEWNKVLALAPDDCEALCNVGICTREIEGSSEESLEMLQRGVAGTVRDNKLLGRAWFEIAIARVHESNADAALDAFERAEKLLRGGQAEQARQNRVAMLQSLGRFADALKIQESFELESSDDYYHLGLAQVKAGKYPECIGTLRHVLDEHPDHALAHYTIACAYALSGNADAALSSIQEAITADPDLAESIASDTDFASLQDDPRFGALVAN